MSSELRLISTIPPSVNHYLGYRGVIKNGKAIAVSYCTNEARKYKEDFAAYVAAEVEKQGWNLEVNDTQHFYVDATFFFPRFDMDSSNYFKVMLDAITDSQKIWADDNVACERVQGIYYDVVNPRIEIVIHPVEYVGVFKNRDAFKTFKDNCKSCQRFARNCSLFKKAQEGRVQAEIIDGECAKYKHKGV